MATTSTAPEIKTWLWIEELAAETGIPVRTFRHWRLARAGGPPSYTIGRRIAYDRKEVQRWIERQRASRE